MKYKYPRFSSFFDKMSALAHPTNPLKIMDKQFIKYGDSYTLKTFFLKGNYIFTRDGDFIDYFLKKNHKAYEKSEIQSVLLRKYLGKGLLTNIGEDWKRQRKLIQPLFARKKIEDLTSSIHNVVIQELDKIPTDKEVNFYEVFNYLTCTVVAKSFFSYSISDHQLQKYADILTRSQEHFTRELRNPISSLTQKLFGQEKRVLNEIEEVRKFIRSMIDRRMTDKEDYSDLLDMLINSRYEDTGEPMSEQQLTDEILIFLVAGLETTANALSFTFYLLGKYEKVQNELTEFIKQEGDQFASLDKLISKNYIQNVLNESMRLFPPAWILDRVALEDDSYEDFKWEKGTVLVANAFALNRNPKNWDDPLKFNPERFEKRINKKNSISFGSGPRFCIGEHFAKIEMQLVLRSFFSQYKFKLTTKNLKVVPYVTLRPKEIYGIKMKARADKL